MDRRRPELRALHTTRRWLVAMLTTTLVAVSAVNALRQWPLLSTVEQAAAFLALGLVVAGALTSSRPRNLWLALAGPFVLVVTAVVAPHGSPPWIPMPNSVTYSLGFAIVLTSRRVGAVLVLLAPAVLAAMWAARPTNIVAGGLQLGGGWVTVLQVLGICIALWFAWWWLHARARQEDQEVELRQVNAEESLGQQERARIWRETASRIHESTLNSIRYVLTAPSVDRERLSRELFTPGAAPESADREDAFTVARLLGAVLADPVAAGIVRIPAVSVSATLRPEVFAACRAAIVEAAHNALRHGHATRVTLAFDVAEDGDLTIRVTDDGSGLPARIRPGIGTGAVLSESLREVGGSATLGPTAGQGAEVVITVPTMTSAPAAGRRRTPYAPFDSGRLLLGAPLAASSVVGLLYYLMLGPLYSLDRTGGAHFWLTVICGVAGSVAAAAVVARRRHLGVLAGLGLVILPALVPWFLRTAEYGCGEVPNLAVVLNSAGFAVISLALWAGIVPGIVGVLTWAAGVLVVSANVPGECGQSVSLALANSLLIIPIAVIVAFVGLRADQRASDRVQAARRRELLEQGRAQAEMELNRSLFGSVEEATALLDDLVAGHPLDDEMRGRLTVADARIRVALQAGATRGGGLAEFAQRAVDAAGAVGRSVQVRAIGASSDPEPLPPALEQALIDAICGSRTLEPVLQVFTDGTEDYVSVLVGDDGRRAAGLAPGATVVHGSTELSVLDEDDDPGSGTACTLLVSRPVGPPR